MWLVPKTALTTTMTAQSVRGQRADRKQEKVRHDESVLRKSDGKHNAPRQVFNFLCCVWWLQEAEVKIWSGILMSEACGFMPIAFITCM